MTCKKVFLHAVNKTQKNPPPTAAVTVVLPSSEPSTNEFVHIEKIMMAHFERIRKQLYINMVTVNIVYFQMGIFAKH